MDPSAHRPRHTSAAGFVPSRTIVLVAFLGLLIVFGPAIWWTLTARPEPEIEYTARLSALANAAQPPGSNGWDSFRQACTIAVDVVDELNSSGNPVDLDWLREHPYRPGEWTGPLAALALMEERGAWKHLAEAFAAPRVVREDYQAGLLIDLRLPEAKGSRLLAKALTGSMRLALRENRPDAAREKFAMTLGTARVIAGQPILIDGLVGLSIERMACETLSSELVDLRLGEDEALAFLTLIDEHRAAMPPLSLNLEGERCFQLDIIQRCYTNDGRGDGRLILTAMADLTTGERPNPLVNVYGLFMPGRAETRAFVDQYVDGMIRFVHLSPAEQRAQADAPDRLVDSIPWNQKWLRISLPSLERAVRLPASMAVQWEGLRTMLLLEIHEARHGEPPASLDDLDPDLRALSRPDPLLKRPFGYRRFQPGEDPHGRTYLLYSFGFDGEDNAGRVRPDDGPHGLDAITKRSGNLGFDCVLNAPPVDAPADPDAR